MGALLDIEIACGLVFRAGKVAFRRAEAKQIRERLRITSFGPIALATTRGQAGGWLYFIEFGGIKMGENGVRA